MPKLKYTLNFTLLSSYNLVLFLSICRSQVLLLAHLLPPLLYILSCKVMLSIRLVKFSPLHLVCKLSKFFSLFLSVPPCSCVNADVWTSWQYCELLLAKVGTEVPCERVFTLLSLLSALISTLKPLHLCHLLQITQEAKHSYQRSVCLFQC